MLGFKADQKPYSDQAIRKLTRCCDTAQKALSMLFGSSLEYYCSMITVAIWATIMSIVFGVIIELFFQVVKYRDALNSRDPVPVVAYGQLIDPSSYLSVPQYLSLGRRKWVNYFLFRLLPPAVILILLSGVLNRYFAISDSAIFIFLGALVSLLLRDLSQVFKANLVSEKLLYIANIIFVLMLSFGISILSENVNLSFIAPSKEGLIDNLWSSLLVAMLVILYLRVTNMGKSYENTRAQELTITNYILSSFASINERFSSDIIDACSKYKSSVPLLYAILIYENMNRPSWMRLFENTLTRLFRLNLTVGIAQVKSKKPLSDRESIYKAAKILKDTNGINLNNESQEYLNAINKYNVSTKYADSIYVVLGRLRIYSSRIFQETV